MFIGTKPLQILMNDLHVITRYDRALENTLDISIIERTPKKKFQMLFKKICAIILGRSPAIKNKIACIELKLHCFNARPGSLEDRVGQILMHFILYFFWLLFNFFEARIDINLFQCFILDYLSRQRSVRISLPYIKVTRFYTK